MTHFWRNYAGLLLWELYFCLAVVDRIFVPGYIQNFTKAQVR